MSRAPTRPRARARAGALAAVGAALLVGVAGCQTPAERRAAAGRANPDKEPPVRRSRRPWPKYSKKPGLRALGKWTLACYRQGLSHNAAVFARGGVFVVRWSADRRGDLLRLSVDRDSFRGWEVDKAGVKFAECVVRAARQGKVVWAKDGVAAMRLTPSPGSTSRPSKGAAADGGPAAKAP